MKLILMLILGFIVGWLYAHYVVANECRKLGKFYVGSSVFVCSEITEQKKNDKR